MSELIGNEFLILKKINSGSTANVYLVKSIKSEEIYAAKVYKVESKYFYKEIEVLKRLYNISGIAHLIKYGETLTITDEILDEDEIQKYIIMDYIPNKDLFYYIKIQKE